MELVRMLEGKGVKFTILLKGHTHHDIDEKNLLG